MRSQHRPAASSSSVTSTGFGRHRSRRWSAARITPTSRSANRTSWNFDSALADLNYGAVLHGEHLLGYDRIVNANQLTLAIATRYLTRNRRRAVARAIGQRYYFSDQK